MKNARPSTSSSNTSSSNSSYQHQNTINSPHRYQPQQPPPQTRFSRQPFPPISPSSPLHQQHRQYNEARRASAINEDGILSMNPNRYQTHHLQKADLYSEEYEERDLGQLSREKQAEAISVSELGFQSSWYPAGPTHHGQHDPLHHHHGEVGVDERYADPYSNPSLYHARMDDGLYGDAAGDGGRFEDRMPGMDPYSNVGLHHSSHPGGPPRPPSTITSSNDASTVARRVGMVDSRMSLPDHHLAFHHHCPQSQAGLTPGQLVPSSISEPGGVSLGSDHSNRLFGVRAPHHQPGNDQVGNGVGNQASTRVGDDLPGFQTWSRSWYQGHLSADGHAYTNVPPNGSGKSGWESETLSQFNPYHGQPNYYLPPAYPYYGEGGGTMDGMERIKERIKEERYRMLEKEFGGAPKVKVSHKRKGGAAYHGVGGEHDDDEDGEEEWDEEEEEEERIVGSVDSRGKLITSRPKLTALIRWSQALLTLSSLGCGLGGAILVKTEGKPPPSGSLASYSLYGASALSLAVLVFLHVLRPCCCDPSKRKGGGGGGVGPGTLQGGQGMVIPIIGGGVGGKKGFLRGGGKGSKAGAPPPTTVNLIVDPTLLGLAKVKGTEETEEEQDPTILPNKRKRKSSKPGGLLETLQRQDQWRHQRQTLRLLTIWDSFLSLLLLSAFGVCVALGKPCPVGAFQGWCDLYNSSLALTLLAACSCLLAVWRGLVDRKQSRRIPFSS
ncbi:hypothetical protein IE53DRAFT_387342 [Violaceomyces palustris]|uniref:Uncharacterized protein n=1 Tax=Violaceomyces palustris TaxID=1673888 RepID=A0ACD0NXB4_9BASI|nr:hypothetical protein IE53DRAFT_387342 [Violaceomyces palustris]